MDHEGLVLHADEHTYRDGIPPRAAYHDEHYRSQRGEPSVQRDDELWQREFLITLYSRRHYKRSHRRNLLIRICRIDYSIGEPQKVSEGNRGQTCGPQCILRHRRLHGGWLR